MHSHSIKERMRLNFLKMHMKIVLFSVRLYLSSILQSIETIYRYVIRFTGMKTNYLPLFPPKIILNKLMF